MKTLTRNELYALVWSEPTCTVAARFGISDRGLGKLCARHDIPVPPRGWWAKKIAGHRVRQPPLPPLAPGKAATVTIHGQQRPPSRQPAEAPALPAEVLFERHPENAILVDPNSRLTHLLVHQAAAQLRTMKATYDGLLWAPGSLDVRISKGSVTRALRIFQTLIRALEARGYPIEIQDRNTIVTVLGETFRVFLKERLRKSIRELTTEEHARRRRGEVVDPYYLAPCGDLTFYVGDAYGADRATSDGKAHRLEDSLNAFVECLVQRAYREKQRRAAVLLRTVGRAWGDFADVCFAFDAAGLDCDVARVLVLIPE